MHAGIAPKGLERSFARLLQVSPSMWSQIKSSQPIGDRLACRVESACRQPAGWLDKAHPDSGMTVSEQRFLAAALQAWRAAGPDGRKRLKATIRALEPGA